jgi:hypothetical protein
MRSHECPANGCSRILPDHLLMCRPHWFQVPHHLRSAVWAAYQGGAGVGSGELMRAQDAAIEAVNSRAGGAP